MTSTSCGEHDECMICLCPLLEGEGDEDDTYIEGDCPEVGAVWPCGHCFHLECWNGWKKEKCPICNQHASLFSKIFISAPTLSTPTAINTANSNTCSELNNDERAELEHYRRMARQQQQLQYNPEQKMLLRDMEKRVQDNPQAAKAMMTMMMMVQARDMRKAERALQESQEECDYTKDVLRVTQSELEQAHKELAELKPKAEQLQKQVDNLKKLEHVSKRHEKDQKQIAYLKEKLEKARNKLELKNKQLSRRNKDISAKRKIIHSQKIEIATKVDVRSSSRSSKIDIRSSSKAREKEKDDSVSSTKELELMKELDSFTMEDSMNGSLRLSMIWD